MRQLYDLSTAPFKKWKPFPGGDHNASVLEEGYFEAISDFISETTGELPIQGAVKEKRKSSSSRR
jgi:abhydrolase domain-containing protein 13